MTSVLNSSAGASHDSPNRSHLSLTLEGICCDRRQPTSCRRSSQHPTRRSNQRTGWLCRAQPNLPGRRGRMGRHGHLDVYENPAGICEYPVPHQVFGEPARWPPSVTTLHRAGSRATGRCGPQKPLFWLNRDLRSSEATLRPPVCAVPFEGQSTPKGSSRRSRLFTARCLQTCQTCGLRKTHVPQFAGRPEAWLTVYTPGSQSRVLCAGCAPV